MIIKTKKDFAACLEHTLLSPTATKEQIEKLCLDAKTFQFRCVCINSRWVHLAEDILHDSDVKVASVISFPLGADSTKTKVAAAKNALTDGADEIDMVADIGAIIDNNIKYLSAQLDAVLRVCRSIKPDAVVKVIIESAALTMDQKMFACHIANQAGVDFVKTSTGLDKAGGATIDDIKLIRQFAPKCRIKASGGINNAKKALQMLEAGADTIGTSSAVKLLEEFTSENQ